MKSAIQSSATDGSPDKTSFEPDTKALTSSQAFEIVWPYLAGIGCAILTAISADRLGVPPAMKDIFTTTASAAGVFAGFMLAAAAILASIGDRPFIRRAKRAGVYTALIRFLFVAMRWSIATVTFSIGALILTPDWYLKWHAFALGAWAFPMFTALFSSLRALATFAALMVYVAED